MLKKITAMVLALVLLISALAGCGGKAESLEYAYTTKEVSEDPLVICMDMETWVVEGGATTMRDAAMNELLIRLENGCGMNDVAVVFIPPTGTERKTYLDRLKIEIMAGGGPDLFLMAYHGQYGDVMSAGGFAEAGNLFEYPQEAMENGFFLPLDDLIANNTQYAEWDKLTEGVLAAGRNEEGQQIVPLSYTLPVILYEKEEFDYTPTRELSWNDMLNDPDLSPYALDLANCHDHDYNFYDPSVSSDEDITDFTPNYMQYILGDLIDYEADELVFTEEELLQRVQEILALNVDDVHDHPELDIYSGVEEFLGLSLRAYTKPMTMVPLYSDDGGVIAMIKTYAAINRNTKHAEEAFAVLDMMLQKEFMYKHRFAETYFQGYGALPIREDIFLEDSPFLGNSYLTPENHQELSEVRNQITGANFYGYCASKVEVLYECRKATENGESIEPIIHEVYEDLQRRVRE